MKILIPFSLLLVGLAIGYAVGINAHEIVKEKHFITDSIPSIPKIVHDTIIKTRIVEVEKQIASKKLDDSLIIDSLDKEIVDTLQRSINQDSIPEEDLSILTDIRLKIIKLPIQHLSRNSNDSDSLLKLAIDIQKIDKKYINVEFWESPINFLGYKLSKSKLIIYGLSPQFEYQLFKKSKVYYLRYHSITYELFETEDFKKFVVTSNLIE